MSINVDNRFLDLACFSKSPRAHERISRKVNVWKYETHKFFQPWSEQKKFKECGFEGVSNYLSCRGRPNVSSRPCYLACDGRTLKLRHFI